MCVLELLANDGLGKERTMPLENRLLAAFPVLSGGSLERA
jgi:hypothetical protein